MKLTFFRFFLLFFYTNKTNKHSNSKKQKPSLATKKLKQKPTDLLNIKHNQLY